MRNREGNIHTIEYCYFVKKSCGFAASNQYLVDIAMWHGLLTTFHIPLSLLNIAVLNWNVWYLFFVVCHWLIKMGWFYISLKPWNSTLLIFFISIYSLMNGENYSSINSHDGMTNYRNTNMCLQSKFELRIHASNLQKCFNGTRYMMNNLFAMLWHVITYPICVHST